MYIETSTDEIIVIAVSCFLWKKNPVRIEIYQKSVKDMPIL